MKEANKKKVEASKKEKAKEVPKKNIKQTAPKVEEPISKKGYEMIDIISPIFGMKEEKIETEKVTKKPSVKKSKKKDNSLIQVISPYYGNFEEKVVEEESEAILTSANEETEETIENIEESETTETVEDEEEKLPTVEDNLRNIANIVKEEQDQLKIIEERTGEFKLDFQNNGYKALQSIRNEYPLLQDISKSQMQYLSVSPHIEEQLMKIPNQSSMEVFVSLCMDQLENVESIKSEKGCLLYTSDAADEL